MTLLGRGAKACRFLPAVMDLDSHLRTLLSIQVKQWQLSQKRTAPGDAAAAEDLSSSGPFGLAVCLKENRFGGSNEAEPDDAASCISERISLSVSSLEEGELTEWTCEKEDGELSESSVFEEGELAEEDELTEEGGLADSSLLEEGELTDSNLLEEELVSESRHTGKSQLSLLYSKYHQLRAQMRANHELLSDAWVQYEVFRDKMNTMLEIIDRCHSIQEQFTESLQDLRLEISETKRVKKGLGWAKRRGSTAEESFLPSHGQLNNSSVHPRKHSRADLPDWALVAQQLNGLVRSISPAPSPKHVRFEGAIEAGNGPEAVSPAWILDLAYDSPLRPFGGYCFHDAYRERIPHIFSLTYARLVDSSVPFCTTELCEGACDLGSLCTLQHVSDLDGKQLHLEFLKSLLVYIIASSEGRGQSANWVKGLLTEAIQKSSSPEDCFARLAALWRQVCS
jgi:hypothetical protein